VNWPVAGTPGAEQTNLSHQLYENIAIHNIRGNEDNFQIDVQGFQLVKHATKLPNSDFENDAIVRANYYPEMVDLVKTHAGCQRCLCL